VTEVGFRVAGRAFTVSAPDGAGEYVVEYLNRFAGDPEPSATRLLLEWENTASRPDGAETLSTEDGTVLGWAAPRGSGADLRVGMREPGSVGRGMAMLIARAFRPPGFLLVHGAGLRVGAQALLAVGVSGAGKSTLSTLFEEADLLSDETLLVELGAGPPTVHATPIKSSSPRVIEPGSATIRALLALEKSAEIKLEELPEGAALQLVLEQALTDSASELMALFEAATQLAGKVQRRTLHFRKDRDFVPLLLELLR
jgi:hypothetical protein